MKVAIKHHPAYFKAKSMGDVMLDIISREQNFELPLDKWAKAAYQVAKQQVNFNTNSSRNQLPMFFRRAIMVIMYGEFSNRYSMNDVGLKIAELEGRAKAYNHCTLIHSISKHKDAIQFPKANQLYIDTFNAIYNELLRQSFLKRFTRNAYNH